MSGWGCPHEVNGICDKVDGAWCRPGMMGCILYGKVTFRDGVVPSPVWPPGHERNRPSGLPGPESATENP